MKHFPWLVVIILIIICIWIIVWWCPQRPCKGTPASEILLVDEHSALWVPFDNAFTRTDSTSTTWDKHLGVLMQFGRYYFDDDHTEGVEFSSITIEGKTDTETYRQDEFTWINVVPAGTTIDTSAPNPIQYLLYPNDESNSGTGDPYYEYQEIDLCECLHYSCTAATAGSCTVPTSCEDEFPKGALRNRSIRDHTEIFGVLTYWTSANGYDVETRYRPGSTHGQYAFKLHDAVDVYVWDGDTFVKSFTEVSQITVAEPSDLTHGEAHVAPIGGAGDGMPTGSVTETP